MMKVVFAVYDHLHTDYRVFKTALSHQKLGLKVKIYGITDKNDSPLKGWEDFEVERVKISSSLPLKINMLIFWFKLFFILLKEKADYFYAHDIFPLLPLFLVGKLRRKKIIYDAHEYWPGNQHILGRKAIYKFWTSYESFFIKRTFKIITVSSSIANLLKKYYNLKKEITIITNLPLAKEASYQEKYDLKKILGISKDDFLLLYQGGLIYNNGLERIISLMAEINNQKIKFVMLGNGTEKEKLVNLSKKQKTFGKKVFFLEAVPHQTLYLYTFTADAGICLIKNCGESFYYSTPNKVFEYIFADIPQISSNFPEINKIVRENKLGITIDPENKRAFFQAINKLFQDKDYYQLLKENCHKSKTKYTWESQEILFKELYN